MGFTYFNDIRLEQSKTVDKFLTKHWSGLGIPVCYGIVLKTTDTLKEFKVAYLNMTSG